MYKRNITRLNPLSHITTLYVTTSKLTRNVSTHSLSRKITSSKKMYNGIIWRNSICTLEWTAVYFYEMEIDIDLIKELAGIMCRIANRVGEPHCFWLRAVRNWAVPKAIGKLPFLIQSRAFAEIRRGTIKFKVLTHHGDIQLSSKALVIHLRWAFSLSNKVVGLLELGSKGMISRIRQQWLAGLTWDICHMQNFFVSVEYSTNAKFNYRNFLSLLRSLSFLVDPPTAGIPIILIG